MRRPGAQTPPIRHAHRHSATGDDPLTGYLSDPTTTLGDLIVRGAATLTRRGVGADGDVLTADSGDPLGVIWQAPTPAPHTLDSHLDPVASVQFAQQQALQFVIENRTSDPGAPVAGQCWLRTDL